MLCCGAAIRTNLDVNKNAVKWVRKSVSEMMASFGLDSKNKLIKFIGMAFKGAQMRIKLSEDETYKMAIEALGNTPLPDAADLVDEIGTWLSNTRIIEYYDNVPYIRQFIDALHELAKADIEIGMTSEHITCSLNFFSEGFKELFDLIMQGMNDQ